MKHRFEILGIIIILFFAGCSDYWDKHYNTQPETVDQNVWEALQNDNNVSSFVGLIKEFHFDTLFETNNTYTLFVPDNDAVAQYLSTGTITQTILEYHISRHFILAGNIQGRKKMQTLGEKFALFENYGSVSLFDGIGISFQSPLYNNGKYYRLDELAVPKPNLYEFYALNNQILKNYIDSKDSVILDKEKSRPIGFDDEGNTIYDTVSITLNLFEEQYFPVKEESRNKTATFVFPQKDNYESALTTMALSLGGTYHDHTDIPVEWQNRILIPHLLEHGVFDNLLEPGEFVLKPNRDTLKMRNILGDSVVINYQPVNKSICSNGYAYDYAEFVIPDSLYSGSTKFEGEWLLKEKGVNTYTWRDSVTVISDQSFAPVREYIITASNDSILKVNFPKKYAGKFSVEFLTESLFPRKYLMSIKTHMDIGGIYNIYVNDELVKTFDYYDYVRYRGLIKSVTGVTLVPEGRYNKFDCFLNNITDYGEVKVKIEYTAPGNATNNGLVIDYIEFEPYNN